MVEEFCITNAYVIIFTHFYLSWLDFVLHISFSWWHSIFYRRASGAWQGEDKRQPPVATGRLDAAQDRIWVTGPAKI